MTSDKQKNEGRSSGARRAGNEADAELATEKTGAANTSAGRIEGTSAEEGTDATVARTSVGRVGSRSEREELPLTLVLLPSLLDQRDRLYL